MMTYLRQIASTMVVVVSAGCATTQWTRDKLEIAEDRLRAVSVEQFAQYERGNQSELGAIDKKMIQLETQLGTLQARAERLEQGATKLHDQVRLISEAYGKHANSSETQLTKLTALTQSLNGSVEELVAQVSGIDQETRGLKFRWDKEAETALQWHRSLVTMLLDAVARAAEEPTDEEKRDSPAVNRLSLALRQMALDMRAQLEVSRRAEHSDGPLRSMPAAMAGSDDER